MKQKKNLRDGGLKDFKSISRHVAEEENTASIVWLYLQRFPSKTKTSPSVGETGCEFKVIRTSKLTTNSLRKG